MSILPVGLELAQWELLSTWAMFSRPCFAQMASDHWRAVDPLHGDRHDAVALSSQVALQYTRTLRFRGALSGSLIRPDSCGVVVRQDTPRFGESRTRPAPKVKVWFGSKGHLRNPQGQVTLQFGGSDSLQM